LQEKTVTAFLLINANPGREAQVVRLLENMREVKEVHLVAGPCDIVAKIEVDNEQEVESCASKVRSDEHVRSITKIVASLGRPKEMDSLKNLEEMVGSAGFVSSEYGGYEITVVDPPTFPWYDVFIFLLNLSFDIWIVRKDESVIILSKTPHE